MKCTAQLRKMVPPARLELASPKATDFKSAVFTNFTKGADYSRAWFNSANLNRKLKF